jgi:hypothetical protein
MRKILALCILVAMVSAFIPSVLADPYTVGTGVEINATGVQPFVKVKWEGTVGTTVAKCWKDDDLLTNGIQVDPVPDGDKTIYFFAICTSLSGVDTIDHVYADVYHPDCTFKYQIELTHHLDSDADPNIVLQMLEAVNTNNPSILTYTTELYRGEVVDYDEVYEEVLQGEADLWWGQDVINYCQPAGCYEVIVNAVDGAIWSEDLVNHFWYVPTVGVLYDFTSVNYGLVTVEVEKQAPGDKDETTPGYPTVRNIGNVPLIFDIIQDDMGLGKTGLLWNVHYAARLGALGTKVKYDPEETAHITDVLGLCTLEKLDFFILIDKIPDGQINWGGTMDISALIDPNFPLETCDSKLPCCPSPG